MAGYYSFIHALYQEVVYRRVPAAQRMYLHRRIGESPLSITSAGGERLAQERAEVARRLSSEHGFAGELGRGTILQNYGSFDLFTRDIIMVDEIKQYVSNQIGQNERLPDLAFVAAVRMPEGGEPEGIWPIAPDLAIEVISLNDLWEKVQSKVQEYFAAGVRQVWLVSWQQGTVSIYNSPTHVIILTEEDTLTSPALLPGFSCRVSDLFPWSARG